MHYENYYVRETVMPTYFQDILRNTDIIRIVHIKVSSVPVPVAGQEDDVSFAAKQLKTSDSVELDLTGNPLEVDLQGDDDLEVSASEIDKIPDNWTVEEQEYFPFDLALSREIMNEISENDKNQFIFLVDGKDARKTLALGVQCDKRGDFNRLAVYFKGCYPLNNNNVSFKSMLHKHYRNGNMGNLEVQVNVLYPILGHNKRRAQDRLGNVANSVFVEAFTDQQSFELNCSKKLKLFLQVNAANPQSIFNPLWDQLNMIYTLIELLQDDDPEELQTLKICQKPVPYYKVAELIADALKTYETKGFIQRQEIANWQKLKVMDMRPEDFLEKLWTFLISLDSLESIRESFNTIFADFTEESTKYSVPSSNQTTIGAVVQGLIEGTMAVPTLSLPAALKFLIELGLNKLHNDYVYLIKNMDETHEDHFNGLWTKLAQDAVSAQISKRAGTSRKSRLTVTKNSQENCHLLIKQLNHLTHLHVVTEFMHLVRVCEFDIETKAQVNENICNSCSIAKSFKILKTESIVDIEFELSTNNTDFIQKLSAAPISYNVKFISTGPCNSGITTIFHYSLNPIFPCTAFNNYDLKVDDDQTKIYYVHEAIVLKN